MKPSIHSTRSLTRIAVLAAAILAPAAPSRAATTTLYASPTGSGSACSSAQPCSLAGAQAAVRSLVAGMSGDIVVQLADGIYRVTSPVTFTAADSGNNGYTVVWQAAPSARPVISGARQVTGWTLADSSKNIWRASVGTGLESRQLYVNGAIATRARTQLNRGDFTFDASGMRFSSSALGYLNNLANQGRVELESINSFTDRYVQVQSISGNFITMKQPGWNNNNLGYDVIQAPFRAGPMYLVNAYEFLDTAGEWYLNTATGVLYYIPRSGENMSTVGVELPLVQALVVVGGTYSAPAHHITFSGITFTGTSWLGPSSNQGYADQQTGAFIAGNWSWPAFGSCTSGCTQFEATRPNWSQMPAAVQVSAAHHIAFENDRFVNLGQTALGIGNDANAHATGVGLGASSITVNRCEFAADAAGGVVIGGIRADAHHPSDSRMINRDITLSNNLVHDIGVEYRGISSFLPTYVTNAVITHNEIYNMPYSGLTIGYGWGANDAGGSNDYANRGLYNYQQRYSTATTASGNQITGNFIHDVMQQMNDGGCIYTLSANPSGVITGNHCLRTNNFFGLYFDEGSRYFTASNNVFSAIGTWATANANANNNTRDLTVTNNWTSSSSIWMTNGDRGYVVTGNTVVTNGSWPAGAQAVIAAAGIQPTGPTTNGVSLNAGGASSGSFSADAYFTGGSTYSVTTAIDTSQLTGAIPPQSVLQTERYGEFTYTIPGLTAGSPYAVTLYFDEVYWTAAGQRTFNVAINGATVVSAFDIFAAAGGTNRAIARTFSATANASGQVVIAFTKGGGPDNPKVCGITVAPSGGGDTWAVTVTRAGTGTGTVTGGPISCGSTCTANVASGTTVTLTATAASGSTFTGWSGACTGTAACALSMTAARAVTATFTQTQTGTTFTNRRIVGVASQRCVDINGASTANGTQAQIWDCNGGTNQSWTYDASQNLVVYGSKCLQASNGGTATGTAVVIGDCTGAASQHWNVNANGTITNVQSGLCMDVNAAGTANGSKIILWTCHGGTNQQWSPQN